MRKEKIINLYANDESLAFTISINEHGQIHIIELNFSHEVVNDMTLDCEDWDQLINAVESLLNAK